MHVESNRHIFKICIHSYSLSHYKELAEALFAYTLPVNSSFVFYLVSYSWCIHSKISKSRSVLKTTFLVPVNQVIVASTALNSQCSDLKS